jgi:hypothetical protein
VPVDKKSNLKRLEVATVPKVVSYDGPKHRIIYPNSPPDAPVAKKAKRASDPPDDAETVLRNQSIIDEAVTRKKTKPINVIKLMNAKKRVINNLTY